MNYLIIMMVVVMGSSMTTGAAWAKYQGRHSGSHSHVYNYHSKKN